MAVITPQSDVYLLKVPLEIDNENQLTFANATAQYNYFSSLPSVGFDDFTYIRKDGVLRVPDLIDNLYEYNYVMYRNEAYSDKWFYAYITGMDYVNDSVTDVSIATDVYQTWMFDLNYKRTFVEREHVNDDTIGLHTIDENLGLGDYMINSKTSLKPSNVVKDGQGNTLSNEFMIVFQVTSKIEVPNYSSLENANYMYNDVFSGLVFFACADEATARGVIQDYDGAGKGSEIIAIFQVPTQYFAGCEKHVINNKNLYTVASDQVTAHTTALLTSETTITRPATLNGYTPKNNKCFVYPFSFLVVSNNAGIDTTFHYEDFTNASPKFEIRGALGQGCTTKLIPKNYKGQTEDEIDSVTGAKYPICAWSSDYYTNWVTQNAVNMNVGVVMDIARMGATYNYNPVGSTIGLIGNLADKMVSNYQAKIHPDQAKGNANSSDILPAWGKYFSVACMSVRAEVASVVDNWFSMFGYKVNQVKVPNITGRRNWNYVKTVGCYIDADIPQDDLQQIKDMFNKGITFWHNPSTFCDYSQNNDII